MVYSFNQFEISACAERGNGGGGGRNFLFGVKNHLNLFRNNILCSNLGLNRERINRQSPIEEGNRYQLKTLMAYHRTLIVQIVHFALIEIYCTCNHYVLTNYSYLNNIPGFGKSGYSFISDFILSILLSLMMFVLDLYTNVLSVLNIHKRGKRIFRPQKKESKDFTSL